MAENFKNIHIGKLIEQRMEECSIELDRAAAFLKVSEEDIEEMYTCKSLDSNTILRFSKLLQYDFFRIYTQHLILYSHKNIPNISEKKKGDTELPVFKKNIYTQEVIVYLVGLVERGKKTFKQIQDEYNIPSTTILRWVHKYGKKTDGKSQT